MMPDIGLGELTAAAFALYLVVMFFSAIPARRARRAERWSQGQRELRHATQKPTEWLEHEFSDCGGDWYVMGNLGQIKCDSCRACYPDTKYNRGLAVRPREELYRLEKLVREIERAEAG